LEATVLDKFGRQVKQVKRSALTPNSLSSCRNAISIKFEPRNDDCPQVAGGSLKELASPDDAAIESPHE
jgi:hypothetical protein